MPKQSSLSLQNKRFLTLFFLIFFTSALYSFELSYSDRLYFKSLDIENIDNSVMVDDLKQSVLYGSSEIRLEAALVLSEKGLKARDYSLVAKISKILLDEGYREPELLENLFDSYFLNKRYDELQTSVAVYLEPPNSGREYPVKIEYYRLISGILRKIPSAAENFRIFLIENETSHFVQDLYEQIKKSGVYLPSSTTLLAEFKIELFKKEYGRAGRSMLELLEIQRKQIDDTLQNEYIVDNVLLTPVVLDEFFHLAVAAGRVNELLSAVNRLITIPEDRGFEPGEVYPYELISGLYETAGFLNRRKGLYPAASELFLSAFPYSRGDNRDRMLWYWFNSMVRYSPVSASGKISFLTENWKDPDYFSDILDELASVFVQKKDWKTIETILKKIETSGPEESVSRYAYLTARAGMESYISLGEGEVNRLLTLSFDSGFGIASGLYYRILAGNYLGLSSEDGIPWIFNERVDPSPETSIPGRKGSSELVYGYLEYNYFLKAYTYLMNNPFSDLELIRETASSLSEAGYFARSIRLMSYYSRKTNYSLTISDLKTIYPDPFRDDIVEISEREGFDWHIFIALVREESHFQTSVVSSAGAVGLSQLMPATAADVAGRLRKVSYDLNDPVTNLIFGGWYLGNLISRTDVLSDALFAYNGGLTRVRRWRKEYPGLPDDLFLEAIPYKETSHYGRKLLVSSVIYGYLYEDISPDEIITLFYREK